ncbi:MAG: flagellar hook-associated protein FlgK [Planctomycetes bacterium]|nr:flagellar hook-associated protein FlgK [Planctomycetota bacterium]
MGLVTAGLTAGRNALISYQGALQVVGNNIANSGNVNYARQSAQLSTVMGTRIGPGLKPGAGVAITSLKRNVDDALDNRLRASVGDLQSAVAEKQAVSQVEVLFNDLTGTGISSQLTAFFNSMSDVQNAPDDLAIRSVAIANGQALTRTLRSTRGDLIEISLGLNDEIERIVADADRVASEIAELNTQIVSVEAGGNGKANALRDRRDGLLRELSETFDVQVREQPGGAINVYVGSEPLIQFGASRGLTTEKELDGTFERVTVRFADSNATINVAGGMIEGIIKARDQQAIGQVAKLDQLAAGIIAEVNAVHADGQGLRSFTSVTASNVVDDPTAALNSLDAGLQNAPTNGSFYITVTDQATGSPVAYRIEVDLDGQGTDTTLEDVVAAIDTDVAGVNATITADNRLNLTSDAGFSFSFGHDGQEFRADTSKLLSALGINTFFEGSGADDIAVRQELLADSSLLAAASENRTGDGINAGRLAALTREQSDVLGGATILEFYNAISNDVAAGGAAASNTLEAADVITSALEQQRQSVSGVSLDEEAIDLMKFERAFQGAARYIGSVDTMLQEMLGLIR